ncbi:MAG: hypothetical protein Q8862_07630 [Bacteroidota bacterium]|nr:hypothetical protein [Bacteroidota bacterium]MDP4207149.1 hypothetical protein [Bacteroidota bacterium]
MNEKEHFWELVSSRLQNELDGEDVDQFDNWIKSKENEILFKECEKIHQGILRAKMFLALTSETAWNKIKKRIKE